MVWPLVQVLGLLSGLDPRRRDSIPARWCHELMELVALNQPISVALAIEQSFDMSVA